MQEVGGDGPLTSPGSKYRTRFPGPNSKVNVYAPICAPTATPLLTITPCLESKLSTSCLESKGLGCKNRVANCTAAQPLSNGRVCTITVCC